jgi:RimJ/RimL family protein N-acetyltransferase
MADHVTLRAITPDDLPILFEQQREPEAIWMAAFTAKDPSDWDAFNAHWAKVLADPTVIVRVILADDQVAGSIGYHSWFGEPEVFYVLGKAFWGRGIATRALALFLNLVPTGPLAARVVKDNIASRRVLERNGFTVSGEDRGYAEGRGAEVEEWLLKRHDTASPASS